MPESDSKATGLSGAFQRLSRTVVGAFHTRLELFGLELEEEKQRLVIVLIWAAAVIFFAILAVVSFTFAIVLACPEASRPYVLAGFGVLYGILTWRGALMLRRQLRERPSPWSGTVGELKKDMEWIRSRM